jgi:NADPH:quinone reductase-like Zn-dependent oxidoreductase
MYQPAVQEEENVMKALRIHEYGGALQMDVLKQPTAAAGQVVVRNLATSFNPIDPGRASGVMRKIFPLELPWIPGGDVSGTIESVGEGVADFEVGDKVFGYSTPGGAYAEFLAIDATAVARRPAALTVEQGAAVAVVGQTAIQAVELGKVGAGSTVLIQGGAGGVGSLAIQIAHKAGAYVITTAQSKQQDALLRLGANLVIDFTQQRFEDAMQPVDAVLDLVGGDTLARSYPLVKPGGVIVTFNQPPDFEECENRGIQGFFVQTKVTTEGLNDFAERVTSGSVVPLIDHTETLWNHKAIWTKRPSGLAVGKTVFTL